VLPRLRAVSGLAVSENVPLSDCTRFGIGGPARLLADASTEPALAAALDVLHEAGAACAVIGGGTNLIASDEGFPGVIVRYTGSSIDVVESNRRDEERVVVRAAAGAVLQDLVDRTISLGLGGLETLTGIPGWVGGAIYGNAGAYGHSVEERIRAVRFLDATGPGARIRTLSRAACEFHYRDSVFKRNKRWIILSADLELGRANAAALRETAAGIRKIRDEKYPPSMRCAGSIFKNLLIAEQPSAARAAVPPHLVREGKVPSAYFLEQAGAKGMTRGGVRVADYHANLIYNAGGGTARELRELIAELSRRVRERFGIELEEEVQHI
jgi:UDP-N-acetylmuramate dehydrogenase